MSSRVWFWVAVALAAAGGVAVAVVPRGIRNNNPMNIRRTGDAWQGLHVDQTDTDYFRFVDMAHGLRAGGIVLLNYFEKYGLDTVPKIIARFAPAHENPTDAYIANVSRGMRLRMPSPAEPAGERFDVRARLRELMGWISTQEVGRVAAAAIPPAAYDEALRLISQRK